MSYLQEGNEVILVESAFCSEIGKEGEHKNNCTSKLDGDKLAANSKTLIWMNYLVPGDDKATLLVQYKYKGKVLSSKEIKLSSAYRYRTWLGVKTNKSGPWTINIEQETDSSYIPVAKIDYVVKEDAQ